MQTHLLPDYLDGSKKVKDGYLKALQTFCKITPYLKLKKATQMVVEFPVDKEPLTEEGFNLKDLMPLLNQDESMKVFLRTYKGYAEKPNKNIIIHKNLAEALSKTKLDIKTKYLPKNFTAFLDIKGLEDNDGDTILGTFVDINQDDGWCLNMGILCKARDGVNYPISHINLPLDDSDTSLAEIVQRYKHVYNRLPKEIVEEYKNEGRIVDFESFDKVVFQGGYYSHIHTILNCILYITNSPELCVEQENNFSKKKSKRETQLKIYTSKKYIILGKEFTFPKEYTCGEVSVSGHFRWQPYGPSRAYVKHIYIKPHLRNYNQNKNNNSGEYFE